MVNELAQWAVLVFMAVFLLGLTRQVGRVLLGGGEGVSAQIGPDIGNKLPRNVLSKSARKRFQDGIAASESSRGVLYVVDEDCDACEELLEGFEALGRPAGGPLAAVSRASQPDHERRLRAVFDPVEVRPDQLNDADLRVTPFVLVLNQDLEIVQKALSTDLHVVFGQGSIQKDAGPTEGSDVERAIEEAM